MPWTTPTNDPKVLLPDWPGYVVVNRIDVERDMEQPGRYLVTAEIEVPTSVIVTAPPPMRDAA
jgi:hypothetical protein